MTQALQLCMLAAMIFGSMWLGQLITISNKGK